MSKIIDPCDDIRDKFLNKEVIVTNTVENPEYFIPGVMDYLKEQPSRVIHVQLSTLSFKPVLRLECKKDNTTYSYFVMPSWVKIIESCNCPIFLTGCTCGQFVKEMEKQGRTYNPISRSWS